MRHVARRGLLNLQHIKKPPFGRILDGASQGISRILANYRPQVLTNPVVYTILFFVHRGAPDWANARSIREA